MLFSKKYFVLKFNKFCNFTPSIVIINHNNKDNNNKNNNNDQ